MSKRPIIPSSASVMVPAIATLVSRRPKAFDALNVGQGRYSHIIAGLRAQAELAIARLADGVVGNTPQVAKGAQLRAYIASEYELPENTGPTKSVGTCTFDRTTSTVAKPAGVIRKGKKLRRDPITDGVVPLVQADYEVASDTPVALNQNVVDVPIIAVREGSAANTPFVMGVTYPPLALADEIFDKKLVPTVYDAGGGSDGFNDSDILRYGQVFDIGQFGPTDEALILAALRAGGVRHILIDGDVVYIADSSWGGSERWSLAVKQSMVADESIGYATRFNVDLVPSSPVTVNLTVRLRDAAYLSDTTTTTNKITATVRSYLDDRDDFNVVSASAIRSVVSRADKLVLRCTDASLFNLDGSPFTLTGVGHAYLAHNAVNISYLPPV